MEFHGPRRDDAAETGKGSRTTIEPRWLMWAVAEVSWADPEGHPLCSRAAIRYLNASGLGTAGGTSLASADPSKRG